MRIVCFGPGPQFKGGLANYNTSLSKAFSEFDNSEVHIVSWTNQYPSIIPRDFIDRKSRYNAIKDTDIKVHYLTNYNNPFSWTKTAKLIKDINPDVAIFQWSIALQGLPLKYIVTWLKKHSNINIIFDLHFVVQKESSSLDKFFTKFALKHVPHFIVHSKKTYDELCDVLHNRQLNLVSEFDPKNKNSQVIHLYHPIYDMFKPNENFDVEAFKNELGLRKYVFLFFGFIRKYKGLHNAIKAFAELAKERNDVSLLIVGEAFWSTLDKKKWTTRAKKWIFNIAQSIFRKNTESEDNYRPLELITELGIQDKVVSVIEYVPNEEVYKYFQVSDAIVLFYEYATPSGVESMAYNFRIPIIATAVGHFPETIINGVNGYLADAHDIHSMAEAMNKIIKQPIDRTNIDKIAQEKSWYSYANAIVRNI
ncbi:MAG TPA: glycosyltransferase [Bacteroidales bacterium]|jgi:glycosyltransferase involved in cell wall biosynthesis|nr:glycosyltransferase [Bacteroidales bacterium]HOB26750.1 glycosyltransferase [Bacteroidales bacterium]HPU46434.1 glycosyltransferase [Bacteroidales bacterium]HPZ35946.1 glycosyltransferase [Bacteroidales bacterium]HQD34388.1 glycosyltransferase [Bacteroidales bacterium]